MRLFLDAHVSTRRVARVLRERGHEVRAADEEHALDGYEDERLLELATVEQRVMVTFNVRDFARIVAQWGAAGRTHAGCLMVVGIDHAEFGLIVRVIESAIRARLRQADWIDYSAWGTRGSG